LLGILSLEFEKDGSRVTIGMVIITAERKSLL
jgi:hypothetical protein